jgi:hypothetical protein
VRAPLCALRVAGARETAPRCLQGRAGGGAAADSVSAGRAAQVPLAGSVSLVSLIQPVVWCECAGAMVTVAAWRSGHRLVVVSAAPT